MVVRMYGSLETVSFARCVSTSKMLKVCHLQFHQDSIASKRNAEIHLLIFKIRII